DLTTATEGSTLDTSGKEAQNRDMYISPDGTHLYIVGDSGNVNQYFMEGTAETIPPYFTNGTPTNQTIAYGVALAYDINATDETEFDCFAVDDTTNFKINCSGMLENNTLLSSGLYPINVTINDSVNNINSTIMSVNVTPLSYSGNITQSITTDSTTDKTRSVERDTSQSLTIIGLVKRIGNFFRNLINLIAVFLGLSTTTPPQSVDLDIIYPLSGINVTQNRFFNVTVNITCRGQSCGEVNVSLFYVVDTPYVGTCYQESANITNQRETDGGCTLNYEGLYYHEPYYLHINYTKPSGVLNSSLWRVEYGSDSGGKYLRDNDTIPTDCWGAFSDTLSFRFFSSFHGAGTYKA
ncbi:hypothetical protein LCGC14_3069000, partial [marine sediment metagenome]